jgi:hypothetical protein
MRSPRAVFFLALCAWCVLLSDAIGQTTADYRHYNFGAIRTYAFRNDASPATTADRSTTYAGPLMDERTRVAIAAELGRRGWKEDAKHPDVYVVARRTFHTEYTYWPGFGWGGYPYPYWYPYGYPVGFGPYGGGWGGGFYEGPSVSEQLRGTLIVDIEDVESGQVIWRGTEERHVHESSSPASRNRRVAKEVAEVFRKFPGGVSP